ncbi:MAG TPA: energy transducer TonB [Thermoanaerobaculia bacterium]|nr:energy transducer TonB [Thermoanaerobaculia bacterium]
MRDAVADVIAERSDLGARALPVGIAVSLLLHAAIFAALWVGANRPRSAIPVQTLNIRFAQPAPIAPSRPAPARRAAQPATKAAITPPKIEDTPPAPAVKPPPAKKEPYAPKQESIFGRSEKQVALPKTTPEVKSGAATPAEGFAVPEVGAAGVTGLEGGDFPFEIYVNQMTAKIGRNWLRPQITGEPLAEVYFVIERDGRIRDAKVNTPSGQGTFDRAALRAVLDSSPLPPLPFGYRGTWLGVRLTFH